MQSVLLLGERQMCLYNLPHLIQLSPPPRKKSVFQIIIVPYIKKYLIPSTANIVDV